MERKSEIEAARAAARAELEQLKNTADFDGNMEALAIFQTMIGEVPMSITREEKLKEERRSAGMFATAVAGIGNLAAQEREGKSVPFGAETGNLAAQEREGKSIPCGAENPERSHHKSEEKGHPFAGKDERLSIRRCRSRLRGHDEEKEQEGKRENKEHPFHQSRSRRHEEEEKGNGKMNYRLQSWEKHRPHGSSHKSPDRHRLKRKHSSSIRMVKRHRHRHEYGHRSSEEEEKREKHRRHGSSRSSPERHKNKRRDSFSKVMDSSFKRVKHDWHHDQHSRHRHEFDEEKRCYSSGYGRRKSSSYVNELRGHSERRRGHERYSSYDDQHWRERSSRKHESRYHADERETEDLEDGEKRPKIITKHSAGGWNGGGNSIGTNRERLLWN